ncbi:ATP cone domain-containing protein [Flagellimonas pacifica]|uniref:Restriction endonuclease n=1 Tax=Flagellimonas pacifica TaxID=1247520 RepID=A0A285MW30_9FLAO|nr:ATP cone domain-containing protein [Allomuricauda parva]SNZ01394.1 Restriction endonuclease [Allomuricauda parva]
MNRIYIIKANGERAPFQIEKLKNSLERAGADKKTVDQIVEYVEGTIYDGITTKQIYRMAFRMLKGKTRVGASRYKLKKAIMELGPSGFPFERFVGKILGQEGFRTEVGVMVQGSCVVHEVDVIAQKDNDHFMIECKFHGDQGRFCNVKIPLYIQSRFQDVEQQWRKQTGHRSKFHQGWVYTNTRFTTDAIEYGKCSGLGLVSWDYPKDNSLKDRIDRSGLHPLTSLTTLTKAEKTGLLKKDIVLCKELSDNPQLLQEAGISKIRQKKILTDSQELCNLH